MDDRCLLLLIHAVQSTASEVRVWSIELTKVANSSIPARHSRMKTMVTVNTHTKPIAIQRGLEMLVILEGRRQCASSTNAPQRSAWDKRSTPHPYHPSCTFRHNRDTKP